MYSIGRLDRKAPCEYSGPLFFPKQGFPNGKYLRRVLASDDQEAQGKTIRIRIIFMGLEVKSDRRYLDIRSPDRPRTRC
jgi:hypothetical protein